MNTFNTKLVPDGAEIGRLVELNLVGDTACAQGLVLRVLQVPASLGLLDELANDGAVACLARVVNGPPDLQVLDRIAVFVLGRALPGDDVSAQGRKAQLENIGGWEGGDDMTEGSVNDGDLVGRGPGEEVAVGRVYAAAEVALGSFEAWKGFVDGVGIQKADAFGGAVFTGSLLAGGAWT